MGLMRSALLAGSRSVWLREKATRYGFVQRAVKRFMPGESLEDALAATEALKQKRAAAVLTYLGENVTTAAEADDVVNHYLVVLDRIRERSLDAEISVKLTHMGLDLGVDVATATLRRLVERA